MIRSSGRNPILTRDKKTRRGSAGAPERAARELQRVTTAYMRGIT